MQCAAMQEARLTKNSSMAYSNSYSLFYINEISSIENTYYDVIVVFSETLVDLNEICSDTWGALGCISCMDIYLYLYQA